MNNSQKIGSNGKHILIFPGGMPRSVEYLQECLRGGRPVMGASSLDYDVSREQYPAWSYLPYVTQPEFRGALGQIIVEFNIGGIFSPHPVVWDYLNRILSEVAPTVTLVNDSPVSVELSGYRATRVQAHAMLERPLLLVSDFPGKASISEIELASLFRHSNLIPGMCDDEKIFALCAVACHTPPGDIVEIGSWWGKSAFVLARLAHCYDIGNLLCVDPWSNEHLVQHDVQGLVDTVAAQLDAEEALTIFEMNLLPYSHDHVNYLRMPSTDGAKHYRDHQSATTTSFGTTNYFGQIALLHVDGNHSYENAHADVAAWGDLVMSGGWVVMDDYTWPFGDGPRRVGDEFLAANDEKIATAFVMGGALFIRLA